MPTYQFTYPFQLNCCLDCPLSHIGRYDETICGLKSPYTSYDSIPTTCPLKEVDTYKYDDNSGQAAGNG